MHDGSFSGDTSGAMTPSPTLAFTDSKDGDSTNFTGSAATNGTASINATTGAWSYEPEPSTVPHRHRHR